MRKTLRKTFCSTCLVLNIFLALLFLVGCSGGLENSEYQKIRELNTTKEKIYRLKEDRYLNIPQPVAQTVSAYPWNKETSEALPLITKEFFRCKGSGDNPSYSRGEERLFDCTGCARHSLPLKEGNEHIYPILLEVLNYLQKTLQAKVVITCGHRCPKHNRYSDPSEPNRTSKHMIGAEVDFYVEGFEKKPEIIVDLLREYYLQDPNYSDDPRYTNFKRYTKADSHVSTPPWYNQEIYIKIYREHEGRDLDNRHAYPYISIQVRTDRETQERVTYTWQQAFYSYLRY